QTGIRGFEYAFVEVGQSFIPSTVPAILGIADRCERTLVLGLYLSMGTAHMAHNSEHSIGQMRFRATDALGDHNLVYSTHGLLPSPHLSGWIVARANEWISDLQ
ncbi:hypothetical protein K8R42_02755, partial [bacterium]|nr:hypothetical protein [bacterium]